MPARSNNNPGCLSTLFPFWGAKKDKPVGAQIDTDWDDEPVALPYRLRDDFLSAAEFSFYKVLSALVGTRLMILAKVRLADIFFVARPNENYKYFNRIAQRHLDFLVCDPLTMKPRFGIELDDASHNRPDRQERDEFVERVFATAELPLLRVPVRRSYTSGEIAGLISPFVQDTVRLPTASLAQPASQPPASTPICPKCGIPMIVRTAAQGEHQGKKFYGCLNYPRCRQVRPAPAAG